MKRITERTLRRIIREEIQQLTESTIKQNWGIIKKTIDSKGFIDKGQVHWTADFYDHMWRKNVKTASGVEGVVIIHLIPIYSKTSALGEQTEFEMWMTYWPYQFQTVVKILKKLGIKGRLGPLTNIALNKKIDLLDGSGEGIVKLSTKKFSLSPDEIKQAITQFIDRGLSKIPN